MFVTILCIIAALLLLCVFIVTHEFGHYYVGKKLGIGIVEFAVGFGPKLWTKVKNGIRYSIRAIPLGGFTQFIGEDEDNDDPRAFNNAPIWKRFLTILAGPVMNLIFALLMSMIVLVGYGDAAPYIVEVEDGMPAYEVGLQYGDRIAAVNGVNIDFYDFDLKKTLLGKGLSNYDGDSIELTIDREGEIFTLDVPIKDTEEGRLIGIKFGAFRRKFSFLEGLRLSFKWMWRVIVLLLDTLWGLIAFGKGVENVGGIVATTKIMSDVIRTNLENVFRIASMISVNLGVFNLLPFPALDGGRLVFLGIEKITNNGVSKKVEGIFNFVGLAILMVLAVLLIFKDFRTIFGG